MRISDWSSDVCSSDLKQPIQQIQILVINGIVQPVQDYRRQQPACQNKNQGRTDEIEKQLSHVGPEHRSKIGRASCRERVCQYVSISVVALSFNIKTNARYNQQTYLHPKNKIRI